MKAKFLRVISPTFGAERAEALFVSALGGIDNPAGVIGAIEGLGSAQSP